MTNFQKRGGKALLFLNALPLLSARFRAFLLSSRLPPVIINCTKVHLSTVSTVITFNLYYIKTLQFIRRADKVKQKLKIFAATVQCTATRKKN